MKEKLFHALDLATDFVRELWFMFVLVPLVCFSVYHVATGPRHKIISIDGCEYIRSTEPTVPLVHKANCKNHEH